MKIRLGGSVLSPFTFATNKIITKRFGRRFVSKKVLLVNLGLSLGLNLGCASKNLDLIDMDTPKPVPPSVELKLEFDMATDKKNPLNFRQSEARRMSASGTFSAKGAKYLTQRSPAVTIFDLRQEPHGLVNGLPITWSSEREWAAVDLTQDEALIREKRQMAALKIGSKIASGIGSKKIKIKSVETEESLIRSLAQNYVRLTVTDNLRPSDEQVDRFIDAVRDLPLNSWAHFHDRTGKGRATVFSVMYDMLRSAETTKYEEIVRRNVEMSGDNILQISASSDWRNPYQREFVEFLKEFYDYAKTHKDGDGVFWSQWTKP